jgi:DNA-binding ferritin-like protein
MSHFNEDMLVERINKSLKAVNHEIAERIRNEGDDESTVSRIIREEYEDAAEYFEQQAQDAKDRGDSNIAEHYRDAKREAKKRADGKQSVYNDLRTRHDLDVSKSLNIPRRRF